MSLLLVCFGGFTLGGGFITEQPHLAEGGAISLAAGLVLSLAAQIIEAYKVNSKASVDLLNRERISYGPEARDAFNRLGDR